MTFSMTLNPGDGAELLDEIRDTSAKHVVLPDGGAEAIALWVLFAHCHDCFDVSPLLAFTSATPECGKSTVLTLIGVLVPRALSASNITPAAVFRTVEKWHPTLIIDEADTFIGDNDELRGILNCGHHRANACSEADRRQPRAEALLHVGAEGGRADRKIAADARQQGNQRQTKAHAARRQHYAVKNWAHCSPRSAGVQGCSVGG